MRTISKLPPFNCDLLLVLFPFAILFDPAMTIVAIGEKLTQVTTQHIISTDFTKNKLGCRRLRQNTRTASNKIFQIEETQRNYFHLEKCKFNHFTID